MNKLIFRYDSRDKIFQQKFGQAFEFPDEIDFDTNFPDEIQPSGDVKCVAFSTCDIAEDQQNIEFNYSSILDLWKRVPSTSQGSDPRDVLSKAISKKEDGGLLPKDATERLKLWNSYWRADVGNQDPFDNVRSTMLLIKGLVMIGTYWYKEWHGVEILPIGESPQNGHAYVAQGWKQINGQPHLIIEAWTGKKMYMSRDVFNSALKPMGMQTWVLSTSEIDAKREKNLIEMIKDVMINLIIMLRNLIKEENVEPVVPSPIPVPQPEPIKEKLKYLWGTPLEAKHSVRVICDEEKLTVEQKNTLCATIGAESGWNPKAKRENKRKDGSLHSTDWGICQWNDYYHGKEIPASVAFNDPERAVRLMCVYWKKGQRNLWVAYKNGSYKKYL